MSVVVAATRQIESMGASLRFYLRTVRTSLTLRPRVWRFRLPLLLEQIRRCGVMSLPIAMLVAGLIGTILVLQTGYQLERFGQVDYVAALVGVSVTREIGPLMTAIIVTGRVGAAFTAELGTMNVNQEIQAAETMAIDPVEFLVVPRFLALAVCLPCLTTLGNIGAICAALAAGGAMHHIPAETFLRVAQEWIKTEDVVHGVLKSFLFSMIITHICCFEAFRLRGGATGVGIATMRAVVVSIVVVLITDAIFTALTQ
jgi:phospholipid/cholesterol/gamma-HCH transport system permease protein